LRGPASGGAEAISLLRFNKLEIASSRVALLAKTDTEFFSSLLGPCVLQSHNRRAERSRSPTVLTVLPDSRTGLVIPREVGELVILPVITNAGHVGQVPSAAAD
jgi:hypothetical protein